MPDRLMRILRREPLVHFVGLAALIFLAHAVFIGSGRERIEITQATVAALVKQREAILGRKVTAKERAALVDQFVTDEILVREAYRRGIDRGAARIRKLLIARMRFELDEEVREPTEAELRTHLKAIAGRYRIAESVSFEQVFYPKGSGALPKDPAALLGRLRGGADFRTLGEPFWLGRVMRGYAQSGLASTFGWPFARRVFGLKTGKWAGPVVSARGTHFVRVIARHPPRLPAFERVRRYLRRDWIDQRRFAIHARKIDGMRRRYRIVTPSPEGAR